MGTSYGLEKELVTKAGFEIRLIHSRGLSKNIIKLAKSVGLNALGILDTYWTVFISYLGNGTLFRFIALILMFIATMIFLLEKREEKNEIQQP